MKTRSNHSRFQVVYLTGAPASGKSTLAHALQLRLGELAVFEYGLRLTQHLVRKSGTQITQSDLRAESAGLATPQDIQYLDEHLLDFVRQERKKRPVLIDTHAVTKERYGFRVTPYSFEKVAELAPTMICMLYTEPRVTRNRIRRAHAGRPQVSTWEAGFHNALQASVALGYAMRIGVPLYLFDSARPTDDLADEITLRISPRHNKESASPSVET